MESGYSLVEVMVSIIILTIAILPMVGMFDMGLRTATMGSNYDKSRALANLKLEEAKGLPFAGLQNNFPVNPSTPDATTGYYDSGFIPASAPFTSFQYRIEKQYMKKPDTSSTEFKECDEGEPLIPNTCSTDTDLMRITVTVRWADGNEYHTLGLVSA
jgi:prepilin-type N-terminal cleavage/methylation domain-containing protein